MAAAEDSYKGRPRAIRSRTTQQLDISRESLMRGMRECPLAEWAALKVSMGPCRLELREYGWCPHVGCKHHLYLDLDDWHRGGTIKLNFPDLEPWEMEESCALEVAERDGLTLAEVGACLNLTRERVRQLEQRALRRMRQAAEDAGCMELVRELDALRAKREGDAGLPRSFAGFKEMQPSDWPSMAGGRCGPPGGRR